MADVIRATEIQKVKLIESERKRENKIYIYSNQVSMKHEIWMR